MLCKSLWIQPIFKFTSNQLITESNHQVIHHSFNKQINETKYGEWSSKQQPLAVSVTLSLCPDISTQHHWVTGLPNPQGPRWREPPLQPSLAARYHLLFCWRYRAWKRACPFISSIAKQMHPFSSFSTHHHVSLLNYSCNRIFENNTNVVVQIDKQSLVYNKSGVTYTKVLHYTVKNIFNQLNLI